MSWLFVKVHVVGFLVHTGVTDVFCTSGKSAIYPASTQQRVTSDTHRWRAVGGPTMYVSRVEPRTRWANFDTEAKEERCDSVVEC